jgi:hypothetical protein
MKNIVRDYFNQLDPSQFNTCTMASRNALSCVDCLMNQYKPGNQPSYDCEEKQKIYVVRYHPAYVSENKNAILMIDEEIIDRWLSKGSIKVLSLGGGPASDLCAVLRQMVSCMRDRDYKRLDFDLTRADLESAWDDVAGNLVERTKQSLTNSSQVIFTDNDKYKTIHMDVTGDFSELNGEKFDLITISYLLSELSPETVASLAEKLDSILLSGGVLLINERPEEKFLACIRQLYEKMSMDAKEGRFSGWAGFSFDDDIAIAAKPTFNMNSSAFVGVKS